MNILITGGAGFIGANTAAHYLGEKNVSDKITLVDNLSRPGVENNLNWLERKFGKDSFEFVKADVANKEAVQGLVTGKTHILHFAGQTAVTTSIKNPWHDFQANALGTVNILEAMRLESPKAILVYSSTNKVYGALTRLQPQLRGDRYIAEQAVDIDESEAIDYLSPYGCSKGVGDAYCLDYARTYGLKTIVFRQSCIYGAHQFGVEDQGWVAHFVSLYLNKQKINIFGDGKQVRDLLYIDDLIDAFELAIKNIKVTAGQAYNIGGGYDNSLSLIEMINLLKQRMGYSVELEFHDERLGDQRLYISDIGKANRDFGWKPKIQVDQGLDKLIEWMKNYHGKTK